MFSGSMLRHAVRVPIIAIVTGCVLTHSSPNENPPTRPNAPAVVQFPFLTYTVSGQVIDAVTKVGIPSPLISWWSWPGMVRDEQSNFSLTKKTIPRKWQYKHQDSIRIKTLYYEGKVAIPHKESEHVDILLRRNTYRFRSTNCVLTADSTYIRPYAPQFLYEAGLPGERYAFYIKSDSRRSLGHLRTITFDVSKIKLWNRLNPFLLHIYRADNPQRMPGVNLVEKSLRLCFYQDPSRKTSFVTYDISAFNIPVPTQGLFVGFEMMAIGDTWFPCPPEGIPELGDHYTPAGPVLRAPCAFADCRTWTFGRKGETGWQRLPAAENCWPLYEEAISVEADGKTD